MNERVTNNIVERLKERSKKKLQWPWWDVIKNQAREFCLATGLHGYKYIAQSQRSKPERILWAIAVFASLCSSLVLMKTAWDHYASHPTLTVIESTHHGIWNYPFPAITVCNLNRMSLNLTKDLVRRLKTPDDISEDFLVQEMRLMNELLYPGVFGHDVTANLTRLQNIINDNGLSIFDVIRSVCDSGSLQVTANCTDLLVACKWNGEVSPCDKLFQQSLSREGLCCTFNYLSLGGSGPPVRGKPKRVPACGYQTGLTLLVNPHPEDYHASYLGSFGVKVMLHDPYDYPDYNAEYKLIGIGAQVFLSISPEETYSTSDVRDLPIDARSCIFNDESSNIKHPDGFVSSFSTIRYSYLNCMAQCRATIIRAKCSCIPYYFPQNGSRICNLQDVYCLTKYKSWYDTSWPGIDMDKSILKYKTIDLLKRPCECQPDCTLYRYPTESSQGFLDTSTHINDFTRSLSNTGISLQNHSIVHIFFSDLVSIQYRRNVHYSWRNLFASFGGLLGLFAGFSLISGFELIYFFAIRVITDTCMKRQKGNLL